MNARQKAKKYKEELELLKRQAVKPVYIERNPRRIDSFVSKQTFSYYPYGWSDEAKKRILFEQLSRDENFINAIELEKVFDEWSYPEPNQATYYIQLDIVRR